MLFGKTLVKCERGQFVTSIRKFAEATDMTEKQVRLFWDTLVSDGMVGTEKGTHWTQITVCNYDTYQTVGRKKGTPKGDGRATDKEYKEIYKEFLLETEDEKYHGFVKYLLGNNELKRPFETCLSLPKDQIDYKKFQSLMDKYPKELIKAKILAMETNKAVADKGVSFSGTLHNWCGRENK